MSCLLTQAHRFSRIYVRGEGGDNGATVSHRTRESQHASRKMFDTEKFIIQVEQQPCLWNLSEKSYSDKFLKQKAWQEIAEKMYEDWNNLTNKNKEEKRVYLFTIFY